MVYGKLGKTNLEASVIGFGAEWLVGKSREDISDLIDYAMSKGINIIDIFMSEPEVRSNIGAALKGKRDKMLVQGHIGAIFEDGQYKRSRDLALCKEAFNDLLARLDTDYIDIGMIHYVDVMEDYDTCFDAGIIDYAKQLKKDGVIKCIGLSSHCPEVAIKAVESGIIDVLMFSINPAYDLEHHDAHIDDLVEFKAMADENSGINPLRAELYRTCEKHNVSITVMKSLGGARLLDAKISPFGAALTVPQCCHYALSRPGVDSVLVGYKTIEQIDVALSYLTASDKEKDYSKIISKSKNFALSGKCMYCNHCLPCPSNINIAEVSKFLDIALMEDSIPQSVFEHYKALKTNASNCIQCGACEQNCPFGVKIIENMQKAQEIFGF